MARNSGAGAAGGIWIFIAIIVYVIVEWGKIILISLAAIAGLFVLYFLGRQIYIRYKWRDNFKVLPKNGLREEITAKALKSKVFMSIQTDNRDVAERSQQFIVSLNLLKVIVYLFKVKVIFLLNLINFDFQCFDFRA